MRGLAQPCCRLNQEHISRFSHQQLPGIPALPRRLRALPLLEGRSGSRPAGMGAVRGADRSPRPRSPSRLRYPSSLLSSQPGPVLRIRLPAGCGGRAPGAPVVPGLPLPRPSRQPPLPRPAHGPSPRAPGPSLPPYLSRPPPPPAPSPVPVTLLGVYARSLPRAPRLYARSPPEPRPRARQPRSS